MRLQRYNLLRVLAVATSFLAGCGEDPRHLPLLSEDRIYVYGDKISFAAGGDAYRFKAEGWSEAEPGGSWTIAAAASLVFRLPPTSRPLLLKAKLYPNVKPPIVDAQFVHVYARGEKITSWRVSGEGQFSAVIPHRLVSRGGVIHVDLHIPGAISPQQLAVGADGRRLGVHCSEMTLEEADPERTAPTYSLGSTINFGAKRGAERYQVSGWSSAEPEFTWTEGKSAVLQLDVPRSAGPLRLRARVRGISRSAAMPFQPTDVFVNEQKVAHWDVAGPAEFEAVIPPEATATTGSLTIEFRIPMAIAPSEIGSSGDKRVLGLCFFELRVTPEP